MKTDRILELIIYLINHDNVPASILAERFHVSVRTIQRDMVTLSAIGIPVYATGGKSGGYSILSNYKMKNSNIRADEQQMIKSALESLAFEFWRSHQSCFSPGIRVRAEGNRKKIFV